MMLKKKGRRPTAPAPILRSNTVSTLELVDQVELQTVEPRVLHRQRIEGSDARGWERDRCVVLRKLPERRQEVARQCQVLRVAMPPCEQRLRVLGHHPPSIELVLDDVGRSALVAFREAGDHGIL